MRKPSTVVIFLGPPGGGKGTQAARLSDALSIPAVSTGEMLREAAKSGSETGKLVSSVMASGQLVSDELINRVVADRLRQGDCRHGCILDGYPRTVAQARFLERLLEDLNLSEPAVFNLHLAVEKIVHRLSRRRQCPKCGGIFSLNRNAESIRCEKDGALLIHRADDNPAAIRQRLEVYRATFADLIDFYRSRNYHEIDAARSLNAISQELLKLLAMSVAARGLHKLAAPALAQVVA
jgi:adenylate kinase